MTEWDAKLSDELVIVREFLERLEPDSVRRQQLIEGLAASHCLRFDRTELAKTVAKGIHKHVCQIIDNYVGL